jgi:hypothetical protein
MIMAQFIHKFQHEQNHQPIHPNEPFGLQAPAAWQEVPSSKDEHLSRQRSLD